MLNEKRRLQTVDFSVVTVTTTTHNGLKFLKLYKKIKIVEEYRHISCYVAVESFTSNSKAMVSLWDHDGNNLLLQKLYFMKNSISFPRIFGNLISKNMPCVEVGQLFNQKLFETSDAHQFYDCCSNPKQKSIEHCEAKQLSLVKNN